MQLTHHESRFVPKKLPLVLVTDQVHGPLNIGSLFRASDAFGVEKFIICGGADLSERKIRRTSRSAEQQVDHAFAESTASVIEELQKKGYYIISLEITDSSQPIHEFTPSPDQAMALVVGDEKFGIDDTILEMSDAVLHIEMFGQNSSMNVAQAASIALYQLSRNLL